MQRDDTSNSDSSWSLVNDDCDLIDDTDSFSLTEDLEIDYSTDDDVKSIYSDVEVCENDVEDEIVVDLGADDEGENKRCQGEVEESEEEDEDEQMSIVEEEEGLEDSCSRYYASPGLVAKSLDKLTYCDDSGLNCQRVRVATTFSVLVTAIIGLVITSTWNMEQCLTYPEMNGLDMELFAAKKKLFSWRLDDWEEEERQEDETFDYAKSIEQCQMNLRDAIRTSAQKSALMRYMKLKELRRETTVQGPVPPPRISVMGETSQPSKSPRPCSPVSVHPCHSWPPHPRFLPTTESAPAPCSCKVGKATRRPTNVTEQCPVTLKSRQSSMKAIRMGYDTFKLPQFEILKLMINNTNSHLPIHQSTYRKKQQQRRINLRRRNMPSFEFGVFHAEAKCNLTSGIKSHLSSSEPFRKTLNPKEFNSYITFLDSIPHRQCKLNSTLLQCERCWWTGFCPKIKKNCNLRRWQRLRKIDPKAFVEKDAELQAIFKKIGWASYLTKVKKTNERMCSLSTRRSSEMIHVEENRKRKKAPSSALLFKRENHRNKLREAPSISDWILTRSTHRALLRNRHLFNAAVTV